MGASELITSRLIPQGVFQSPSRSEELVQLLVSMAVTGYVYISAINYVAIPEGGVGSCSLPESWYFSPLQVRVMFRYKRAIGDLTLTTSSVVGVFSNSKL